MASRPAASALSCLHCRTALFRKVANGSFPAFRAAASAPLPPRLLVLPLRPYTTTPPAKTLDIEEGAQPLPASEGYKEDVESSPPQEDSSATPWYLEVEPPKHAPMQHIAPLPEIPEGSPPIFEPILKYVYEEMGLDDLTILDLRDMEPPPALGSNLMMLFGTARSERHLHVASSRLVKWLRYEYRVESRADGLIGPGELKTKLRRLRKKAKLMGSSALPTGGDDGISTGWICVNLGTLGSSIGESARFDEAGKVSGFGSTTMGTTIVVQVMTESRRKELNLERLWGGQLQRSQESEEALKEDAEGFFRKFGKKLPPVPRQRSAKRPQKGKKPSPVQKRSYSTTRASAPFEHAEPFATSDSRPDVDSIVLGGQQVTLEEGITIIRGIFDKQDITAVDIDQALQLLRTLHERGMSVLNYDTTITLIECLGHSREDQINAIRSSLMHMIMRGVMGCPTEAHIKRLLQAFVYLRHWPHFWSVWHIAPRHGQARSADLYHFVLHQALVTQTKAFVLEALRTVVPQMGHETPPVLAVGKLWETLKDCLLFLEPGVVERASQLAIEIQKTTAESSAPLRHTEIAQMYRRLDLQNREARRLGLS